MCGDPDCVAKLLAGDISALPDYENRLQLDLDEPDDGARAKLRYSMQQAWYYCNEWNLGDGVALVSDDTGTGGTFPLSRAHHYQQQKEKDRNLYLSLLVQILPNLLGKIQLRLNNFFVTTLLKPYGISRCLLLPWSMGLLSAVVVRSLVHVTLD